MDSPEDAKGPVGAMSAEEYFDTTMAAHRRVAEATGAALREEFVALCRVCLEGLRGGGKLLFFGNGGSAADAQHIATEFVVKLSQNRAPLAAIALTTDTSALTAAGNDFGFESIFARQVEALGRPGDVAIGISTSGNSANIVAALERAKAGGLISAALSGRDGGRLVGLAEPLLVVPSDDTNRIQEMHITLLHMLCGAIERDMGLV